MHDDRSVGSSYDWTFKVEDVRKVYGGTVVANDGISLHVEPGKVYGLLGPNGARATSETTPRARSRR